MTARIKGIRAQLHERMLDAIPEQDIWLRANDRAARGQSQRVAPQEGHTSLLLAEHRWGNLTRSLNSGVGNLRLFEPRTFF